MVFQEKIVGASTVASDFACSQFQTEKIDSFAFQQANSFKFVISRNNVEMLHEQRTRIVRGPQRQRLRSLLLHI